MERGGSSGETTDKEWANDTTAMGQATPSRPSQDGGGDWEESDWLAL